MMSPTQALVQGIGEQMQAADLIESRQLLQYVNSQKADYHTKQPLLQQKKDYLDLAHLFPETPLYGGARSRHLADDRYRTGKEGEDADLKNDH